MRKIFFLVLAITVCACDDSRLFESYNDFDKRFWDVSEKPEFEFSIQDTVPRYSVYCNLRNAEVYPYADFRFTYTFLDSTGTTLGQKLMVQYLFDRKTGEPFGESGLGDIYDHQFLLMKDLKFKKKGNYRVRFEQFMRKDSLEGVLAVGLRVERAIKN